MGIGNSPMVFMELFEFIKLLNSRKQNILFIVLLVLSLAMVVTLVYPLKYSSSFKILVIQNFSVNTDPYTASKSNEHLSNVLARVVYSNSFYANVLITEFNIDKNYFSGSVEKQMKKWIKTVDAKVINDSGIIVVNVYHTNRLQAEQIAKSISYILQTKHTLYHGGGNNVDIRIIDEPIVSSFPVKPNVFLNLFLGLIVGLLFAFSYIYLFPEEKFDIIRLFGRKNRNQRVGLIEDKKLKENNELIGDKIINQEFDKLDQVFFNKKIIKEELLFNENDNLVKQSIEKNISDGSMKNIFGKSHLDNF